MVYIINAALIKGFPMNGRQSHILTAICFFLIITLCLPAGGRFTQTIPTATIIIPASDTASPSPTSSCSPTV
jgi:hypothetical protein